MTGRIARAGEPQRVGRLPGGEGQGQRRQVLRRRRVRAWATRRSAPAPPSRARRSACSSARAGASSTSASSTRRSPRGDWETTEDGVLISPDTCELAGQVAGAVLR